MTRKSTATPSRNRDGFTLIENVIAIFMITVAVIGIISVTIMIINGNDFSKRMTTAATLAKGKLEEVKRKAQGSYSGIVAGTTTDYFNEDSSTGASGAFFTRITTVWADTPATNMKTVEVEVNWHWGGLSKVRLRTIVGQ